ncbi:MAG: ATP synthase subunit C [Chlamydiia bacterium]|nr:ATP synthase subunit C [Chlamydiia bacterium]
MSFAMIGPAIVLGLACLGSAIGCGIAGMASHGVMARVDENHGKFIGMSALPSSQSIYGFVLMLLMKNAIDANTLSAWNGIGIGVFIGLAIMLSAIYQGMCAATGIQASAKQPAVYGKCLAALGIVESFSLFAFVFALLLI